VHLAFAGNAAKFAPGQFYYCIARNADQDVLSGGGCDEFAIHYQKNVFGAALRNVAVVCQHDCLIEAILHGLAFSESRIDVGTGYLGSRRDGIVIDAPPEGNATMET